MEKTGKQTNGITGGEKRRDQMTGEKKKNSRPEGKVFFFVFCKYLPASFWPILPQEEGKKEEEEAKYCR